MKIGEKRKKELLDMSKYEGHPARLGAAIRELLEALETAEKELDEVIANAEHNE